MTTTPHSDDVRRLREAVETAMSEHHAYHCTVTDRLPSHAIKDCPAITPALDALITRVRQEARRDEHKRLCDVCTTPMRGTCRRMPQIDAEAQLAQPVEAE